MKLVEFKINIFSFQDLLHSLLIYNFMSCFTASLSFRNFGAGREVKSTPTWTIQILTAHLLRLDFMFEWQCI